MIINGNKFQGEKTDSNQMRRPMHGMLSNFTIQNQIGFVELGFVPKTQFLK